jgi:hypothetical protein
MKPTPSDPKNRNYLILNISEINLVDFDEILETSLETLKRSVDGAKTIIKWEDKKPKFINDLKTKEGPYTYDQITQILETSEWTKPFVTN